MKKILLHYPFVPSYRIPIFNEMSQSELVDLIVLSSDKSKDKHLLSSNDGTWKFNHIKTSLKSVKVFSKSFEFEFGVVKNLITYRSSFDYYVILSNPNIISSWLYSITARILGYKVIFWGHGLLKKDSGFKSIIRKLYYKIPNKFWLYGNNAVSLMVNEGVRKEKLSVIYNSLDYLTQVKYRDLYRGSRNLIRDELGLKTDDVVFICIGRLLKKLEIDKLIHYISLFKDNQSIKVFIVGSGPEQENLKILVQSLNLNKNFIFTGAIYDESILAKYYTVADASIVMGVVGLAAMHCLAYGVPLVTHSLINEHCPEIEAIIDGKTGFLFEKNNPNSFFDAINRLVQLRKKHTIIYEDCILMIEQFYTPKKQLEFMLKSLQYD